MNDRLDISLHDDVLAAEIDMVTDLMITANHFDLPLCHHTVDTVLRVPGRTTLPLGQCRCHDGSAAGRRSRRSGRTRPRSAAS